MNKIYNLTIDTKRKSYSKVLGIKQNENNVVLNITLVQNSIALDLTDCTVRLNYLNNNNVLLQMADMVEVKEGKVKVNVLTKVLKDIGETPVDISIFDKDNRKITSATFTIVVQASIYTNDVLTKEDMDLVQTIHVNEEERQLKEETRQKNEQERIESENNRENKEKERQEAELKRDTAEKDRSNAETKRITSEEQRVEEETNRIEAEVKRVATENKRVIAETERDTIEKERIAAEKDRVEKEDQRIDNEKSRISQEIARIEQENGRKIQEKDRVNKEKQRVASEIERLDNETIRQKNEKERIANEDIRKDNEGKREVRETDRVTSMKKIIEDWTKLKEELQNLEGGGDMTKLIYDTNRNGIVDDSEKLGGKHPEMFIQKDVGATWNDINKYNAVKTTTSELKFDLDGGESLIGIDTVNNNFRKLDDILYTAGMTGGKLLYNQSLADISETGTYLVNNLENAPDIPPKNKRWFLVKCYKSDSIPLDSYIYYEITSLGTGKKYTYCNGKYDDIPCTSHIQPQIIYIDSEKGNDDNYGTEEMPVKTWACAESRIPKILTRTLRIHLINVPSDTDIGLAGLSAFIPDTTLTWLTIDGHNTPINNLNILNCNFGASQWSIALQNMNINVTLNVVQSSTVNIINSKIRNLNVDNSVARCSNNTVSKYSADYRAFIQLDGHNHHEIQSSFGCSSTYGSLIYVNGTHPHGDVSEKHESFGGKVEYVN